jgi:excisionase family DNA binding protein
MTEAVALPATAMGEARPVLSVAEAAVLLGISEWLLLQEIRRGTVPHRRCGRRILLSRANLLAWLESGEQTAGE